MINLKQNMIITGDGKTFFISDVDKGSSDKILAKGMYVEQMSFGIFDTEVFNRVSWSLLNNSINNNNVTKKIIQADSFRDMLFHLDDILDKYNVEPIIYSVYDKESGEMYIVLIDEELRCIFIDTFNERFGSIYEINNNINRQELLSLLQGRNTEHFKIINEFDTVEDALNAPEMFTYKDVLDTL